MLNTTLSTAELMTQQLPYPQVQFSSHLYLSISTEISTIEPFNIFTICFIKAFTNFFACS